MKNIKKSFNGVSVLEGVNLVLEKGSVHALMGENGAGKSTLMNILCGIHKCDEGEITVHGSRVEISSPFEAQNSGIAMIHQELSPIPELTVAENIFFGREYCRNHFLDYDRMFSETKEILNGLHIHIDPKSKMKKLKVADQQLIEIAKVVSRNAEIIVMDEPTSAITDKDAENLFEIIENLKKDGKGIIYISHKIDEVIKISDTVTVLRDGVFVNTWKTADITADVLITSMVGRKLDDYYPKMPVPIGDKILEVKNLSLENQFSDISFEVKAGEILGIAGLVGAGRTEVMKALFGITPADTGEIILNGKRIHPHKPIDAIKCGLAYVTEDRKGEGIIPQMSVLQNISLASMKMFTSRGFVNRKREAETIDKQIESLRIKTSSPKQKVLSLSGGNQQKVVLAKWLIKAPKLLILDEPTRGIDVGAKTEIYKLMGDFVSKGNAIIMVSSEMPEVMGMSDRIMVFSNRTLAGELIRGEFNQESIMRLAVSKL
nr:sugar ABC transporter ATP-binding protein [Caproiciproducens sp. NJN-50]